MPSTEPGKAIASRNATTHGLFARDVVLPSLGEDPDGYRQMQAEWKTQLAPRTLLDHHYVEKIAAASWRLRRLHRWQAQIFEDDTLTEGERLDRLDKVLRHETALHRQIDTAVKMLSKDAPELYQRRLRDKVLQDTHVSERECRESADDEMRLQLEMHNRMYRIGKATDQAMNELSLAPLDAIPAALSSGSPELGRRGEICQNELPFTQISEPSQAVAPSASPEQGEDKTENCKNEPVPFYRDPKRRSEFLDPDSRLRSPSLARRRKPRKSFCNNH